MGVPGKFRAGGWLLAGVAGLCGISGTAAARDKKPKAVRQPGPWLTLGFDRIGVARPSKAFLDAGGSLLTVHFLDDTHVLVTSSLRKLIPRLVGDPVDDDDRLVGAEVVELPSGKVLAQTEWHTHDHARYLWALGHGRFLVRIGESLSVMRPLENLKTADPLQRVSFPGRPVAPEAVLVSEDGRILTLETPARVRRERQKDAEGQARRVTLIDVYRLGSEGSASNAAGAGLLVPEHLGSVTTSEPLLVPIDGNGFLRVQESANNHWEMTFDAFAAKPIRLGQVDSTCTPRLEMVSPGEFVAMTCRGGDDHVRMISYGLDGKETWEEQLGDFGSPVFVHAAAAGRFAVSNVAQALVPVPGSGPSNAPLTPTQEVRVYQIASGDLLLRVPCTPVFKTAENFDLSADGRQVVVVRDDALVFYRLPPPGKGDADDMAEVAKFAPPPGTGKVDVRRMVRAVVDVERGPEDVVAPELAAAPAAVEPVVVSTPIVVLPPVAAASAAAAPPEPKVIANGDDQAVRSKPPSLLEPGESAEGGKKKAVEPK